jgi:hypothetical protein
MRAADLKDTHVGHVKEPGCLAHGVVLVQTPVYQTGISQPAKGMTLRVWALCHS